ncbi:hypothetical protein [Saccharospirillum mangrovi]|uniref:hypothetical protein n=1 Tax=Saccharospirillum mangrovi TaxID=2161747 RepID=UPI0013008C5D|nr:hypothetical protein [Saccharospirillum mangrovi]
MSNQILLDELNKHKDIAQSMTVFVGGSRVSGYGNCTSDIDVYVINHSRTFNYDIYINNIKYDISCIKLDEYNKNCSMIPVLYEKLVQTTKKPEIIPSWLLSLYRLRSSFCIYACNNMVVSAPSIEMLAFLYHRFFYGGYAKFKDMLGAYYDGDLRQVVLLFRDYIECQALAYLSLSYRSFLNKKWTTKIFLNEPKVPRGIREVYEQAMFSELEMGQLEEVIIVLLTWFRDTICSFDNEFVSSSVNCQLSNLKQLTCKNYQAEFSKMYKMTMLSPNSDIAWFLGEEHIRIFKESNT